MQSATTQCHRLPPSPPTTAIHRCRPVWLMGDAGGGGGGLFGSGDERWWWATGGGGGWWRVAVDYGETRDRRWTVAAMGGGGRQRRRWWTMGVMNEELRAIHVIYSLFGVDG
ncbi:hypothetical protein Dimus_006461 [Dionaea muscipula]